MKTIILIFVMILNFGNLFSQSTDTLTAENFANISGALIEKKFISLGFVEEIDIRLLKVKDINSNKQKAAIRMEYLIRNELALQTKISYIESDELESFTKAISLIKLEVSNNSGDDVKEIIFKCKSGLVLGAFYDGINKKWTIYIQLDRNDPKSTVNISIDEFEQFEIILNKAKTLVLN